MKPEPRADSMGSRAEWGLPMASWEVTFELNLKGYVGVLSKRGRDEGSKEQCAQIREPERKH